MLAGVLVRSFQGPDREETMPRNLRTALRAVCLLLIAGTGLAACASGEDRAEMQASAKLQDGKILLRVDDIPPGRALLAMVLVEPSGRETPAKERRRLVEEVLEAAPEPESEDAEEGTWDGILSYVALDGLFEQEPELRQVKYLEAEITPKDLLRYVVDYRDSRIELRYRNAEGREGLLTIPAPGPARTIP